MGEEDKIIETIRDLEAQVPTPEIVDRIANLKRKLQNMREDY
jgi:hypothetical protein